MKLVFAGTPAFAATALQAIIEAGFDVALVLSQPDRPSGRGMKLTPSAVKSVALAHDIRVAQPTSLKLDGKYPDEAQAATAPQAAACSISLPGPIPRPGPAPARPAQRRFLRTYSTSECSSSS